MGVDVPAARHHRHRQRGRVAAVLPVRAAATGHGVAGRGDPGRRGDRGGGAGPPRRLAAGCVAAPRVGAAPGAEGAGPGPPPHWSAAGGSCGAAEGAGAAAPGGDRDRRRRHAHRRGQGPLPDRLRHHERGAADRAGAGRTAGRVRAVAQRVDRPGADRHRRAAPRPDPVRRGGGGRLRAAAARGAACRGRRLRRVPAGAGRKPGPAAPAGDCGGPARSDPRGHGPRVRRVRRVRRRARRRGGRLRPGICGGPVQPAGARPPCRARHPDHRPEEPMKLTRTRATATAAPSAGQMPAPAVLEVTPTHVRVGDGYAATYAVCGYPAEVGPAWLVPLLSYPGRVTVAVHTAPVPAQVAAPMLTKQRARLESTRRIDAERGKLGDPMVEAAATDAADLAERVARGASKLQDCGIYVTVHGRSLDELHDTAAGVRSAAASMLLDLQPATFRHHLGYLTTLPLGVDALGMRRIFDTESLAAAFPFASGDLAAQAPGQYASAEAVLYGVNTTSQGVVMWNRWAQDNHNSVVLARSGAGKSYFIKVEILRSLYQGVVVDTVDPEDEYPALAEHVGGTVIRLGAPGVRINPFDLGVDAGATTLRDRQLAVHTIIAVMLGGAGRVAAVSDLEKVALDRAITATYTSAGITHDPATWTRPAPLLRDLAATLIADPDPAAQQMAARLAPWLTGSFKDLFDGPTTSRPEGHLVVWSLRHLPDELRTIGTLLALDAIWRRIDTPAEGTRRRRRLVVVDEAWLLMRDGHGARFLSNMAKQARKRGAGLTVVTQAFGLTGGEARLLLSVPRGEGLLIAGRSRVPFRSLASGAEHRLAVTGIGSEQQ